MTGIVKGARGLPRFMADCGFWRHPKWSGTDLAQIGLFIACLSYCYEHETDGVLPGPGVDDLACALGLKPRQVKPALASLLSRGSLEVVANRFAIVDFASHNPTSSEIREHREARSAAGKKAAAARWNASDSDANRNANRSTARNARVEESRGEEKDPTEIAFNEVWARYPKKDSRKLALKAYTARRNEGIDPATLATAVTNYAAKVAAEGTDPKFIMNGATFFGPNERWLDYLEAPKLQVVASNGRIDHDRFVGR